MKIPEVHRGNQRTVTGLY